MTRNAPRRLTDCWRSKCFVGMSPIRPAIPTPAELTSTSSPPCASTCSATSRAQSPSCLDVGRHRLGIELGCGRLEPLELPPPASGRSLLAQHAGDREADPDEPPVTSALGTRDPLTDRRPPSGRPPRAARDSRRRLSAALSTFPGTVLPARTLEAMSAHRRLTSLAKAGGCAAKYSAARLEQLLAGLVPAEAADLLVGLDPADDAAVYRLDDADGARLHRRLLPARRRRPARLRADRGDERAQRRVRDGRAAAARALRHRVPRGAAGRGARRGARGRGRGDARGRGDPRRRSHDPRRRAEVRARGRRNGASGRHLAEEHARGRATSSS